MGSENPSFPTLDRQHNVRYWLRCLRTLLPTDYTSNDLNRTSLAFFCVTAFDVLGELGNLTKPEERAGWIDWIYLCQLPAPKAGFRGSPATNLGQESIWDPGNLPSTFFALTMLLTLGDDLSRVDRKLTLEWVASLQREDGSFAEMLELEPDNGMGKRDTRFMHVAAGIRWILRGKDGKGVEGVKDIDVDAAERYIKSTQAYDYGFGASPGLEAHGGLTFCAIAGLELLDRLKPTHTTNTLPNPEGTLHWLVARQQPVMSPTDDDGDDNGPPDPTPPAPPFPPTAAVLSQCGFNGRCNKRTDTCYSFWCIGALDILKKAHLVDAPSNRAFLLERTAHIIGGFAKLEGDPPDILHSFMGLAVLSIFREEGLNRIDSALCITRQTKERLQAMSWWSGVEELKP